MLEEIQNKAIEMYNHNMRYLEINHNILFNKLKLYEKALELNQIVERYSLEYKDNYFDIYDNKNKEYYYNMNSYEYSKNRIKEVNFSALENTFKTFYEKEYTDEVIDMVKNASITSNFYIGNAAISHYIQKNISKDQNMKTIYKYFIFGVGLGIHLSLLHEKIKAKKYLFVEPSLEIFRLSLFITNYEYISQKSDIHFAVALSKSEFHTYISMLSEETFLYDQYIKFFMFSQNCELYIKVIQNFLVSQRHILYSYDRSIESFNRTYEYMSQNYNFLDLSDVKLFDKPVLLLAAGPSLSDNIDFVKKNRNKFVIVSLYVLLPLLEKKGIIPDVVTQYDQQDKVVMNTINQVKDKTLFDNCIFIFASHVVEGLMNSFPKSKIYVYQALYKVKDNYKILSFPSIGEITYAILFYLGVKKIYLLGLDMALSEEGNSHVDSHASNFKENNSKIENISFRSTRLKVKGNFREEVETLPLFQISINSINKITKLMKLKNIEIYNLSDGAYFEGTDPLRVNEIEISEFEKIDKKDFQNKMIERLSTISSTKLSQEDIEYNIKKLEDAELLYEEIKKFHKIKYKNMLIFKKDIFRLFDNLIYKECKCDDLQDILLNFYKHNLPYIFHFFNIQNLKDEKKHVQELNKLLFNQTRKIFDEYLSSFNYLDLKPKS